MDTGSEGGAGRRGKFFDDLAGMAGGAFSVVAGLRSEVEAMAKSQVEMMVQRLELVRREDLDAALEVARRAREESSALAARVAALEAKLAGPATTETPGPAAATATSFAEKPADKPSQLHAGEPHAEKPGAEKPDADKPHPGAAI